MKFVIAFVKVLLFLYCSVVVSHKWDAEGIRCKRCGCLVSDTI